jgi:hypothetical protein
MVGPPRLFVPRADSPGEALPKNEKPAELWCREYRRPLLRALHLKYRPIRLLPVRNFVPLLIFGELTLI